MGKFFGEFGNIGAPQYVEGVSSRGRDPSGKGTTPVEKPRKPVYRISPFEVGDWAPDPVTGEEWNLWYLMDAEEFMRSAAVHYDQGEWAESRTASQLALVYMEMADRALRHTNSNREFLDAE